MEGDYFYALSLTEAGSSVTFDPLANAEEHTGANYKLHVRQILLDHTAKEGEYNVVQVETMSLNDAIKTPIAVLKVGETRSVQTDLEFPDAPVIFKLIAGNGPVHIHGYSLPVGTYDVEDIDDMEEELIDEEDAEDDEDDVGSARKKAKLSNNSKPIAKDDTSNSNTKNNKKK